MKNQKNTILVIRASALGDVAMCIPALYSLANKYPQTRIVVLTQAFFTRLFINHPSNITLVKADWKGKHKGVKGMITLLKELSGYNITHVVDFHNVLRSWVIDIFFRFKFVPVRMVDKMRKERVELTRSKNRKLTMHPSYITRYANVLEELGFPIEFSYTSLNPQAAPDSITLPDGIVAEGVKIGIAPFARYKTKTYPVELMEQVVEMLSAKNYKVYLFGSRGKEEEVLKQWAGKYENCKALPGLLSLEQELALMEQLDVMISMDSANMHMASLVNTPVVSIWGGTTPHCGFLGWQQKDENALYAKCKCQPCSIAGTKECPLNSLECMYSITPDMVCSRIERVIENKKR